MSKATSSSACALSNGFVALSGSLPAQYQGYADAQMGIGMIVWGSRQRDHRRSSYRGPQSRASPSSDAIMGSILFRLLVAIALRWGLQPNDLKLITAVFVFAALCPARGDRKTEKPEGLGVCQMTLRYLL